MNSVEQAHDEAMTLAEDALMARMRGDRPRWRDLIHLAFVKEREALGLLAEPAPEPTRSILHRSAAALALDCGELREAERLVSRALCGEPPTDIADELRDLMGEVQFERRLSAVGISLAPGEIDLSLEGNKIGPGFAESDAFLARLHAMDKMVRRTDDRLAGRPFDERPASKGSRRDHPLFVGVPRLGSFAVSVRVGHPWQLPLPGLDNTADIVEELMGCLELVSSGMIEGLKARIPDSTYYRNFLALVKNIAPDGDAVRLVGLVAPCTGGTKVVRLNRPGASLSGWLVAGGPSAAQAESVRVRGELLFADARRTRRNEIRLVDQDGGEHVVVVPKGMLSDIVKPLWEDVVEVTGVRDRRGRIRLSSIVKVG